MLKKGELYDLPVLTLSGKFSTSIAGQEIWVCSLVWKIHIFKIFQTQDLCLGTFDTNLICEIYYISPYALKNVCRNED